MYDLAIINGKVYINGAFTKTNVYILGEKIAAIDEKVLVAKHTYDASERLVLPGLIDPHVHFALGSKMQSVDDFESGSMCCARGGVTTYIDFLDPISTSKEIKGALNKRMKLAKNSAVNYGFHLTLKDPKDIKSIIAKLRYYNLKSIKIFTTYSDSGRRTYDPQIKELLEYSSLGDFIVMAHIEKDDLIDLDPEYTVSDLLKSRPSAAETEEALHIADLVKETKGRLYMVHLSSGRTLKALVEKYESLIGTSFFIESCPHYFRLTADKLKEADGYKYTMAPPLRTEEEREYLEKSFKYIYSIGTDHCSYTTAMKNHTYLKDIPMGIGGVEHSFDIMYTLFGDHCIAPMTINPAIRFGLYPAKGHINIGADADIIIYDTSRQRIIEGPIGNSDYTVYEGMLVNGRVESTIVGGNFVLRKGEFLGGSGHYVMETK